MKKFKHIALWLLIVSYLAVAFSFVAERRQHLVCNEVEINIVDSLQCEFVSKNNIMNLLQRRGINLIGTNFKDIDLENIESIIDTYPPVEEAEVYKTIGGKVVIDVKQKKPILRVIDTNNESYYIDQKGFVMKLSGNYTSRVIIANGHLQTYFPVSNKISVLDVEKASNGKRVLLADLYKLALFISNHKFWNAQIQQIYVNNSLDFELIPRVGSHTIVFGTYSDCEEKFANLMSLYKNGLPATGWNKYETINLKYQGQVVCTKRE